MLKETIYDRLNELAEEAVSYDELPTALIIYALLGAKHSGQDALLAKHVQDFTRLILMPNVEQRISEGNNTKN